MPIMSLDFRICNLCETVKPFSEFHFRYGKPRSYCKICGLEYQRRNRHIGNAARQRYVATHAGAEAAATMKWRKKNVDKHRAYAKKWNGANLEKRREYNHQKRQKRYAVIRVDRITPAQLEGRVAIFGGRCWICRELYEEIDHVKPLAKGGRHIPANVRPICRSCNAKKHAKWPFTREMVA